MTATYMRSRLSSGPRLLYDYNNSRHFKLMYLLVLAAAAIRLFQSCIDLQVQWLNRSTTYSLLIVTTRYLTTEVFEFYRLSPLSLR